MAADYGLDLAGYQSSSTEAEGGVARGPFHSYLTRPSLKTEILKGGRSPLIGVVK